jgi:hypothetical protein
VWKETLCPGSLVKVTGGLSIISGQSNHFLIPGRWNF